MLCYKIPPDDLDVEPRLAITDGNEKASLGGFLKETFEERERGKKERTHAEE